MRSHFPGNSLHHRVLFEMLFQRNHVAVVELEQITYYIINKILFVPDLKMCSYTL